MEPHILNLEMHKRDARRFWNRDNFLKNISFFKLSIAAATIFQPKGNERPKTNEGNQLEQKLENLQRYVGKWTRDRAEGGASKNIFLLLWWWWKADNTHTQKKTKEKKNDEPFRYWWWMDWFTRRKDTSHLSKNMKGRFVMEWRRERDSRATRMKGCRIRAGMPISLIENFDCDTLFRDYCPLYRGPQSFVCICCHWNGSRSKCRQKEARSPTLRSGQAKRNCVLFFASRLSDAHQYTDTRARAWTRSKITRNETTVVIVASQLLDTFFHVPFSSLQIPTALKDSFYFDTRFFFRWIPNGIRGSFKRTSFLSIRLPVPLGESWMRIAGCCLSWPS